ncbi:PAS domain S-box protein [Chryseobacterium indologenes]|uniref:PAS domain S-box protein n=1 Tax=Chryseobacterium indologenes TaxID=253 RepID=UPI000B51DE94|nr:PAS domain S-box protein [Chryseobacterium indologenes]ASE62105.1 PAS domain S-box protein [Chryseobacterium indologenes]
MEATENIDDLKSEIISLRCRLAELTDFVENGNMPLHWVNGEGIIIWANKAELDLLGYNQNEYIGFPIQNFHADQQIIADLLAKLSSYESVQDFPARLICKNGNIKNVVISSNVLTEDGKFVHTRCFTKDVTGLVEEQKRKSELHRLLKENEERLRLAISTSNMGTWDLDMVTGKLHISSEMQEILGIPPDMGIKGFFSGYIHPDDKQAVLSYVSDLKRRNASGRFGLVFRFLKSQTGPIWVSVQGEIQREIHADISRIIGCVLDITDLKNSEEYHSKLVAIINSSFDAIISKTLNGIVSTWNASAEAIFGYSAEEMIGQPILKIIPEERLQEEDFILERLRNGESINHFETQRLTKSGKLLDVSLTISPIKNEKGEIMGISKIARDISEKKQEEKRKNDFVSMVSHELKTPLTSILLSAQAMQRSSKKGDIESSIKMSAGIETQAKKMTSMIQDFLSLARIEEGKIQMRFEYFQLAGLMNEIVEEVKFFSKKHTIKIQCDPSFEVLADRDKIGQVLTNLLTNAVKYSPNGGMVTMGAEKSGNGHLRIFVSDEGVGISKRDQQKLFRRFFRVEQEEITNISGFGIGLYIVAEILHYHDTTISVESEEGIGSTFQFILDNNA